MKKRTFLFLILFSALLLLPARAADYALVPGSPTTAVGNEFLLRINLKDASWANAFAGSVALRLQYNSEELEFLGVYGGLGSPEAQIGNNELIIRDQGTPASYSLRLRFKALRVGSSAVALTEAIVRDANGADLDCELHGGTVTVLESGDDALLYNLWVLPGELSPRFSSDVTHYTLRVDGDTVGVQVIASPNGYYATAFVEGHWDLKDGHNLITIDMTSGGGCSALYTIDVFRGDEPEPEPTPEPTPEPVSEAESTPEPTPQPTPEVIYRDSEETLRALDKAEADIALAQLDAAKATKTARTAVVISVGELLFNVLLLLYIWIAFLSRYREEDEEEDYAPYREEDEESREE